MSNILSEISLYDTIYKLKDDNAVTQEQLEEALANIDMSEIESHIANKSNPHEVTAEQVGALPVTGGTIDGNLDVLNKIAASNIEVDAILANDFSAENIVANNIIAFNEFQMGDWETGIIILTPDVSNADGNQPGIVIANPDRGGATLYVDENNRLMVDSSTVATLDDIPTTAEQVGAVTKEYVDEAIANNTSSGIYVQATAPENPKDGDIWVDLSDETTYIYAEGETF